MHTEFTLCNVHTRKHSCCCCFCYIWLRLAFCDFIVFLCTRCIGVALKILHLMNGTIGKCVCSACILLLYGSSTQHPCQCNWLTSWMNQLQLCVDWKKFDFKRLFAYLFDVCVCVAKIKTKPFNYQCLLLLPKMHSTIWSKNPRTLFEQLKYAFFDSFCYSFTLSLCWLCRQF